LSASPCTERGLLRFDQRAFAATFVIVQHVREDTRRALNVMRGHGLSVPLIVGISYSLDGNAHAGILADGHPIEVLNPDDISARLEAFLDHQGEKSTVLVDVGGYGATLVAKPQYSTKLIGVVEETNNGLWRYQASAPLVPVVQIASCDNKHPENVRVGDAVVEAATQILIGAGRDPQAEFFAVLGYGGIGENVVRALAKRGLRFGVYDTRPQKRMLAHVRDVEAPGRQLLLAKASVVIGCSGQSSVLASDDLALKNGVVLISGSSKAIEFSDYVAGHSFSPLAFCPGMEASTNGKAVLVNGGQPVNFHFGSLPLDLGDFQFANIIGSIEWLLSGHMAAGIHELCEDAQSRIAEDWLTIYGLA